MMFLTQERIMNVALTVCDTLRALLLSVETLALSTPNGAFDKADFLIILSSSCTGSKTLARDLLNLVEKSYYR